VIVDHGGERVAVQCKNNKRRVGNKPVREVYADAAASLPVKAVI
jgi:HJR/Mrr/RecB family endonuclease